MSDSQIQKIIKKLNILRRYVGEDTHFFKTLCGLSGYDHDVDVIDTLIRCIEKGNFSRSILNRYLNHCNIIWKQVQ